MIEDLVPAEVAVAEIFGDPPSLDLFPEERPAVARAVPKRLAEFAGGRHCARAALARLGVPVAGIPRGVRGAPGWPAGVVGSITHCGGYCAAAVARAADLVSIGIDAEPAEPLPPGVLGLVASPDEQARLARLAVAQPAVAWDRVLFSAKESVYKAWYPLMGRFLDFTDADMVIDPAGGSFHARLLVPGPVVEGREWSAISGRFTCRNGLVVTAVARRKRMVCDASAATRPG